VIPIIGRSSDIQHIPNPAKPEQKIFAFKAQRHEEFYYQSIFVSWCFRGEKKNAKKTKNLQLRNDIAVKQ